MSRFIRGVSDKYDERFERLQKEPVVYVHMDTTGVNKSPSNHDRITRILILADGTIVYDKFFNDGVARLSTQASAVSGISREHLLTEGSSIKDEISNLTSMLKNKLFICVGKDFMLDFFEFEGIQVDRDDVIDLKAIVGQMNHTYSRTKMNDVLDALYPGDYAEPKDTWERSFLMYECGLNLKEMVS